MPKYEVWQPDWRVMDVECQALRDVFRVHKLKVGDVVVDPHGQTWVVEPNPRGYAPLAERELQLLPTLE